MKDDKVVLIDDLVATGATSDSGNQLGKNLYNTTFENTTPFFFSLSSFYEYYYCILLLAMIFSIGITIDDLPWS